jgi:hypothetical protein
MLAGSVYVYLSGGTAWSYQNKLSAPDGVASDFFGRSIGLFNTNAIIGSNGNDGLATDAGM